METKQQNDIKKFLFAQIEGENARELFAQQSELLDCLVSGISGKTENQTKTLIQTILRRISNVVGHKVLQAVG